MTSQTTLSPSNIDEVDRKIVEHLQDDGVLTNTEIAQRLGVTEATIRRRRARLQEEDVLRIVAVANPFKLGFNIIAIVGIQVEKSRLSQVERALIALPEVRFLGVTLGTYDLMLEAWFGSNDELLHFVTETLARIVGIQRTESFQVMRLSKYTYDWGQPTAARQASLTSRDGHSARSGARDQSQRSDKHRRGPSP